MAQTEVSSVIRDIINAFRNGSTVFKRNRGRKHKRQPSQSVLSDEDKPIHNSLLQRPQEIQQSYDQSVAKHGRQFEIGDSRSQTSLAQILLVLNTGLIKLLNQALSHDSKSRGQSRNEILSLSESAAMDTLHALSELNTRLTSASRLDLRIPKTIKDHSSQNKDPKANAVSKQVSGPGRSSSHTRQKSSSSVQQIKRPQTNPRLANGGWIRSKSDPSVVSVVTPNKVANKSDKKRPSASRSSSFNSAQNSNVDLNSANKKSTPPVYSPLEDVLAPLPNVGYDQFFYDQPKPLESIPESRMRRHPSMYIVPSDFFDAFPTMSVPRYEPQTLEHLFNPEDIAPVASKPFISRNTTNGIRPRPPSMMTFKTTSTKIGEIPEHKIPDRTLTDEQQMNLPMPYVIPEMLHPPIRKKRGFKFWKKQISAPQALVA